MGEDAANGEESTNRFEVAVEKGSQLLGALTGGAVSLVGGPEGALGGAAAGWAAGEAVRSVGLRVLARMTSREEARVGAVAR